MIGKGGKGIQAADAMNHVWGYTIINDMTARDWQGRHSQWLLGKSFDTFCPMGPWLVTADVPEAGRCGADRDRRHRGAGEPAALTPGIRSVP